jgi:hypothetical protein
MSPNLTRPLPMNLLYIRLQLSNCSACHESGVLLKLGALGGEQTGGELSINSKIVSDERLKAEEQHNYIVFYLIELKIMMKTL